MIPMLRWPSRPGDVLDPRLFVPPQRAAPSVRIKPQRSNLFLLFSAEASSLLIFGALCRFSAAFRAEASKDPSRAWSLFCGLGIGAALCVSLSRWLQKFEMQLKEREPVEPSGMDRRHVIVFVGMASILWDSLSEWRNPSPEQGWHFEVQRPVAPAESAMEWQEKMGRIWELFGERMLFGFGLMVHMLRGAACCLRLLQLLHVTSTLMFHLIFVVFYAILSAFLAVTAQAYLAVKVEWPSVSKEKARQQRVTNFLGGASIPRDLLPRIISFVPARGFPLRHIVDPGPRVASSALAEDSAGLLIFSSCRRRWSVTRKLPRDERVLLCVVGFFTHRFRHCVEGIAALHEITGARGHRLLSTISAAPSGGAEVADGTTAPPAGVENDCPEQRLTKWQRLWSIFWLPLTLPLSPPPADAEGAFLLFVLVGLLKHYVLLLIQDPVCRLASYQVTAPGTMPWAELRARTLTAALGLIAAAVEEGEAAPAFSEGTPREIIPAAGQCRELTRLLVILPTMTLFCVMVRLIWLHFVPKQFMGLLARASASLERRELALHSRPL